MYIKSVKIRNVRSVEAFDLDFPENPAGWHVIIGDNGAGKSSCVRSIALGLIGPYDSISLRQVYSEWLTQSAVEGSISLVVRKDDDVDGQKTQGKPIKKPIKAELKLVKDASKHVDLIDIKTSPSPHSYLWSSVKGWFSCGFGPFRRFTGGDKEWIRVEKSAPSAGAHVSLFGEDVALTEALAWLKDLDYRRLKSQEDTAFQEGGSEFIFNNLIQFINGSGLLPQQARLNAIGPDGPLFLDGNGAEILVNQLSDGFRSILSLTFELIRQLIRVYTESLVFSDISQGVMQVNLPGVVLIDEVDAHLHPTWQTRIGQWFTSCFPQIQFIVTTHSPLICRAADTGTIWRLAAPGSTLPSGEVTGDERNRLIYGNVLDAFGTEVFGENVSRSKESSEKLQEMAALNLKSLFGDIAPEENEQLQQLRQILPTSGK